MAFIIDDIIGMFKDLKDILPKPQQKIITQMINGFSGRSVLYANAELEYTSKVSNSVFELKKIINSTVVQLQSGSDIQNELFLLQKVCDDFLAKVNVISEKLRRTIEELKDKIERYDTHQIGAYSVSDNDRQLLAHYKYIGEVDLLKNDRINMMDIRPEFTKVEYITAFNSFQTSFGARLTSLAFKTKAVLPDVLRVLIPYPEMIREAE